MHTKHIAFIGGGHMTTSMVNGLLKTHQKSTHIQVSDPNEAKRKTLSDTFSIHTSASNHEVVEQAEIVVLAVKPHHIKTVITELKQTLLTRQPLLVSIAAGIRVTHLERWLEHPLSIVRAMPNTPALLQVGATGLFANTTATLTQKNMAESLLRTLGITVWVNNEEELDIVSALSGSGPAYFFLMMEALQQGAEQLGLSSSTAKLLTLQTALGAARMAMENELSLTELKHRVASPGGITEQALQVLETGDFRFLLSDALRAAKDHAVALAKHWENL
jgi:pyrroline-5-carboxylate reductase